MEKSAANAPQPGPEPSKSPAADAGVTSARHLPARTIEERLAALEERLTADPTTSRALISNACNSFVYALRKLVEEHLTALESGIEALKRR
jgi:hypothetical protein